ncbi:hypothetical protein BpHYR1_020057 [Brachionus plicatilis]|uniref:Uncharacterized protein n=1 Tax=Brachionus plicatilis TaxID=10195 RepID=A0A3M7QXN8_BRAPC|nr:hypothetical protein BpHYR1_020057 [Brachionus plicatilis]
MSGQFGIEVGLDVGLGKGAFGKDGSLGLVRYFRLTSVVGLISRRPLQLFDNPAGFNDVNFKGGYPGEGSVMVLSVNHEDDVED